MKQVDDSIFSMIVGASCNLKAGQPGEDAVPEIPISCKNTTRKEFSSHPNVMGFQLQSQGGPPLLLQFPMEWIQEL